LLQIVAGDDKVGGGHWFDPCALHAAIFAPSDDPFATAITFKTVFRIGFDASPSLPATNAKRLRKGAERRSNPCFLFAARWIASLRSP
jgi:hypothetical protein